MSALPRSLATARLLALLVPVGAMATALAAFALARPGPVRAGVWLAVIGIAASGLIGAFHAGVEYGWWQGITGCTSTVHFGGGDPLKEVMDAPLVRCDVVQWKLFGISLAGYNFLVSGAVAGAIFVLLGRAGKGGRA